MLAGPSVETPNITEPLERSIGSVNFTQSIESKGALNGSPSSTVLPVSVTPATPSSSDFGIGQPNLYKADSAQDDSGVDVGEDSGALKDINEDQVQSIPTIQGSSSQPPELSSGSSTILFQGTEPLGYARSKPTKVHIPRSKLDRLRKLKIGSPSTVNIEDVEFSAVNKEKLRNFSRILASKKDQIELFGKELPLCRVYLGQVREDERPSVPYICVQGLNNAADITRIHSAMSHKRYKPLYDPLRLCYETSYISHVWNRDTEESQASQHITIEDGYGAMQTLYQYKPATGDKTYCGAISRTVFNHRTCLSTFGGLVEVDGMTYLMTCQHSISDTSSATIPSLPDTLSESDVPFGSEGPLVFCLGDLPSGLDGPGQPDAPRTADMPTSPVSSNSSDWKNLSVSGPIRKGREWSLIPIADHYILPNLVEKLSTEKGKSVSDLEIHYLDETSDPRPGSASYIVTGSTSGSSGIVSTNTSFIIGGGTDGLLEVWTILLDKDESKSLVFIYDIYSGHNVEFLVLRASERQLWVMGHRYVGSFSILGPWLSNCYFIWRSVGPNKTQPIGDYKNLWAFSERLSRPIS